MELIRVKSSKEISIRYFYWHKGEDDGVVGTLEPILNLTWGLVMQWIDQNSLKLKTRVDDRQSCIENDNNQIINYELHKRINSMLGELGK